MIIQTKDTTGTPNGTLMPLWSAADKLGRLYTPQQVYAVTIPPGAVKGPHLHRRRCGYFFCLAGHVQLTVNAKLPDGARWAKFHDRREYRTYDMYAGDGPVLVLPGDPAEIRCAGDTVAIVVNMPDRPWTAEDPDDHPDDPLVKEWNPTNVRFVESLHGA